MLKGSCLCGTVTYAVEGELGEAYLCHCRRCRKASGSAFASNARVKRDQFRVLTGESSLRSYHNAATGLTRRFCGECGSPIVSERTEPAVIGIRIGTLDTPLPESPFTAHIFVASKAEWDEIHDDLPQHAELPPR